MLSTAVIQSLLSVSIHPIIQQLFWRKLKHLMDLEILNTKTILFLQLFHPLSGLLLMYFLLFTSRNSLEVTLLNSAMPKLYFSKWIHNFCPWLMQLLWASYISAFSISIFMSSFGYSAVGRLKMRLMGTDSFSIREKCLREEISEYNTRA